MHLKGFCDRHPRALLRAQCGGLARRAGRGFAALALAVLTLAALPGASQAQNPFSAAVTVNNRAVTYWEIQQRQRFLQLLNAPPEAIRNARETLIDERLQLDAAERLGLTPAIEEIEGGMQEFAARANLTAPAFIAQLEQLGVAGETFRDFVAAGVSWRSVVRTRFGPRAQVTEAEIDRAMATASSAGGTRYQIAEIVVRFTETNQAEVRALLSDLSSSLDGDIEGFADAARRFSDVGSARNGGLVGWRSAGALAPELRGQIARAAIGDVTSPVPRQGGLAIVQLRDREENAPASGEIVAVEYALIPVNSDADAVGLRNTLDTCDDLYGVRPGGFERQILPIDQVPGNVAPILAGLDANEIGAGLTNAQGAPLVVMLCGRSSAIPEGAREDIRNSLFQRRLATYANGYLAELRAEAIITEDP